MLALGGRRDLHLIHRLLRQSNLAKLKAEGKVLTRKGIIPGDQKKELPDLRNKRISKQRNFPTAYFSRSMPPRFRFGRTRECIAFTALRTTRNSRIHNCSSSRASSGIGAVSRSACTFERSGVGCCLHAVLSFGSGSARRWPAYSRRVPRLQQPVATYFLALTSSRVGHYITETLTEELVTVPLPLTS